jgi:hypothetical protein
MCIGVVGGGRTRLAGDESDIGTIVTLLGLGKKKILLDLVMFEFGLVCLQI